MDVCKLISICVALTVVVAIMILQAYRTGPPVSTIRTLTSVGNISVAVLDNDRVHCRRETALWGIPEDHTSAIFQNGTPSYLPGYRNPCWLQPVQNTTDVSLLRCIPYFYELGVAKSGTTALFSLMTKHPDIKTANRKEPAFWKYVNRRKNFAGYLQQLSKATRNLKRAKAGQRRKIITVDATPSYFSNHGQLTSIPGNEHDGEPVCTLAHTLYNLYPGTKLIVIMRHPTDRLYSHYHHKHRRGFSPVDFHKHALAAVKMMNVCLSTNSLRNCVFNSRLNQKISQGDRIWLRFSMYYPFAREWLRVFPRQQIFFIKAEEFYANVSSTMAQVFRFLELDAISPGVYRSMESQIESRQKSTHGRRSYRATMWNTTRALLDDFFQPFKQQLASLLEDDKWLFLQ